MRRTWYRALSSYHMFRLFNGTPPLLMPKYTRLPMFGRELTVQNDAERRMSVMVPSVSRCKQVFLHWKNKLHHSLPPASSPGARTGLPIYNLGCRTYEIVWLDVARPSSSVTRNHRCNRSRDYRRYDTNLCHSLRASSIRRPSTST